MKSDSTRDRDKKGARQLLLNEFICGYLTALYIHTAYVRVYCIHLRVYLIGFFNCNLARICQEVASPFALFLMWFISTRAKKYAQTVGGIWSYIQTYIHACVCVSVTRLSVVKCQTRVFFLIGKVKGESTICLGMRSRSRSRWKRHVCDTRERERERTGNWEPIWLSLIAENVKVNWGTQQFTIPALVQKPLKAHERRQKDFDQNCPSNLTFTLAAYYFFSFFRIYFLASESHTRLSDNNIVVQQQQKL